MRNIIPLAMFFTFILNMAFAETITLKSGKIIEGKILEKAKDYIEVETGGEIVYYENKYIQSIEPDKASPTPLTQETPASSESAEKYLKSGLESAAQGRFEEAEAEFKKGRAVDNANPNISGALEILAALKNKDINQDYATYLFQGSLYLMDAEYQQALGPLEKAWDINPKDPNVNYNLGVACYNLGDYQKAVVYLVALLNLQPNDPEAYLLLGNSYFALGRYEEAKKVALIAQELSQKREDRYLKEGIEGLLQKIQPVYH